MNLVEACRALVDRGRFGDQNAIGMMVAVRERAEKGDPKAQKSHDLMLRYARATEDDKHGDVPIVAGRLSSALAVLREGVKKATHPLDYIKAVRFNVPQVGETMRDAMNSAQAVSQGPEITPATLQASEDTFTEDSAKQVFRAAVNSAAEVKTVTQGLDKSDPQIVNALQLGYVMGLAIRMQTVRKGGPIAVYSKIAAWELGEI